MKPIELLQKHCEFITPNDGYVILAVSRKKDTTEITNSQEIVFREVVKSEKDIIRKYDKEIHANEIVLLAYYIAAVNIENAYRKGYNSAMTHLWNLPRAVELSLHGKTLRLRWYVICIQYSEVVRNGENYCRL